MDNSDTKGSCKMSKNEIGWTHFSMLQSPVKYELVSFSKKRGTIRGIHYHPSQSKIIRCVQGSIFDVIIDMTSQERKVYYHTIKSSTPSNIYVPTGYAHGYQTLEDNTKVIYLLNKSFDTIRGMRWNDPKLKIEWPITPAILSKRDKSWSFI